MIRLSIIRQFRVIRDTSNINVFQKYFKEFLQHTEIPNVIIKFGIYEDVDKGISITHMCSKALLAFIMFL